LDIGSDKIILTLWGEGFYPPTLPGENMAKKKKDVMAADLSNTGAVTTLGNILARIVAVFAASGLSVIGAGAVVGISTAKAMILAGTLGVATVVEKLARGFLNDGKLDADEINGAFASVDKRAENAAQ
jgi:hypothetical protein